MDPMIQGWRRLLAACPRHHPQRAYICEYLISSLSQRFAETGSAALNDEMITLGREALALRPAGHPDRAMACNNLGGVLWMRYAATGGSDLLDEGIMLHREALALRPVGHPDRSMSCNNLANALGDRYKVTGTTALLNETIMLHREALALRPAPHPLHAKSCNNLATTLQKCYEVTGSADLLDEMIALHRKALSLWPAGHPDRASSCINLANILQARHAVTVNSDLLDELIPLCREALALRPAGHPDHAVLCTNLANALQGRYEVTGVSALLDEAITLHRKALALRPIGHPDCAASCGSLASALWTRYSVTGSTELLDETITLFREALALPHAGDLDRAVSCNNLATALQTLYELTGSSNLLDETITLNREALALHPAGHPDHAISCSNLANALQSRFDVTASSDLLDEMIMLRRKALALHPAEGPHGAVFRSNLALALHIRFEMTGTAALSVEAITLHREALALSPAGHFLRANLCSNLAATIQRYYNPDTTDGSDLLDEAITLHREALTLRPAGHPDRAMSYSNLATALQQRSDSTGSTDLLHEAITLHRKALALRPAGHSLHARSCNHLAEVLWKYHKKIRHVTVIDEVLALARETTTSSSVVMELWRALLILCKAHMEEDSLHFSVSTATRYLSEASALYAGSTTQVMRSMQNCLDSIWSLHSTWTSEVPTSLLDTYSNLIDRLSWMTGYAFDTSSQLRSLQSVRAFGSDGCVAALISGRPSQAIELIDHANGVIWAQALHQRDPQLQDVPGGIASELESLLRAVSVPVVTNALTSSEPAASHLSREDFRHQQNSRIQTILTEVRAMPGLERFMLGKTYTQLRKTASVHPVVVLVSAREHIYALIIRNAFQEHPDVLPLKITSDRLARLRHTATRVGLRTRTAMRDVESESDRQMRPGRFEDTALGTLASLWHDIVKPVVEHLQLPRATGRAKPRLHWCPTGDFSFLPIHAAGIYSGPEDSRVSCSDYVVSSYTPTLSALLNAQHKAPQTAPAHLNILAVAEDGSGPGSTVSQLFFVEPELTCVRDTAKASGHDCSVDLITKNATIDSIAERIQTAHFVHLACHGTQDQESALESGFYLSNGLLKVSKLMHLNLDKAWFAYLSACETAKSDTNQPDQVVHLTATMLHAGFKSVVATMWSMADKDGPDMARWFYEDLLSNAVIDADAVAYAVDAAVEKLRATMPRVPTRWAPYVHMGA